MADVKISALPAATSVVAGTDVAPLVSGGVTTKATPAQMVTAALNTTPVTVAQGGTGATTAADARTALGLGTIATQAASAVTITGGTFSGTTVTGTTSVTTPVVKASSSAGITLQNASGTAQMQMGSGGGSNISLEVATNINPANAAVSIQPTGTGTLTIKPATAGAMDNMTIGATTPLAAKFTTLQATGSVAMTGAATAGNALVQISNTGAGYALLVEDETNPDATPFVIHESGGVSVGNTTDAGAGNLFVLGNIGANVISALQQLTVARSGGGQVMQIRGSLGATNPVLTISTSDAASGVFININTVDGTTTSSLAFTGIGGTTMWSITSTGDFFPRQGTTSMKEGFMFVPGGAGAPTEVPTNENTGITPLYFDEANNRLYAYNGGWKYTQLA